MSARFIRTVKIPCQQCGKKLVKTRPFWDDHTLTIRVQGCYSCGWARNKVFHSKF